jgi:hypothetical protein
VARPKKEGEKKRNISVSATATEKFSVERRANLLGFRNPANYLLALHEAEQRLGLHVKMNFNGQRWFVYRAADPVPEDITLEDAIHALVDDRPDLASPPAESIQGLKRVNSPGKSDQPVTIKQDPEIAAGKDRPEAPPRKHIRRKQA